MRMRACGQLALAAWIVGSIGLADVSVAQAQGGTNRAAAEALFVKARKLMEEGQFAEACPKLEESQKLDPAVGTLMYMGLCYEKSGRIATAWATYRAAESAAKNARQADREKKAKERAVALEGKLSHLRIAVPSDSQLEGLEVKRDGEVVGKPMWGEQVPVDPGEHVVTATAPGRKAWKTTVQIGDKAAQEVINVPVLEKDTEGAAVVPAASASSSSTPATTSEPTATSTSSSDLPSIPPMGGSTQRTIGFVVGGVGLVALGVGAYYGFRARSKESDSNAHCLIDNRDLCDETGLALNKEAKDARTIAIIGLAAGGVATVGGLVLVLTAKSSKPSPSVALSPSFAPTGGGMLLRGTW